MILNLIKKTLRHELVSGAAIIFIGSFLANLFNFLFNLFMSRNLSISDYGTLASLISLLILSTLPAGAVIPTIVRFAASYFAKENFGMVRELFFRTMRLLVPLGILVLLGFVIFTQKIAYFFNIPNEKLVVLVGLNVFLGFVGIVIMPLLQAKLAFITVALINSIGSFLKLFLGVIVVFLGFSVGGVMWALLFSSLIPYLLGLISLRPIFREGRGLVKKIDNREVFTYGVPAMLTTLSLASFITTDILLVKHFFDPKNAGIYAGLSLVGRVIFFFSAPIGTVMFPLITQKHTREENYHHIFRLSLLLVFISSLALTLFYFLFPEFTIRFFIKNEEYLVIASFLGLFGLFVTLYSLLSIITNFFLSTRRTEIFIPITLGAILQATLIWFYHETFLRVIIISLSLTSLLLISLLLYYWKLYVKKAT